MKKLKIIIPVFVIVSIAVIFWTIAGLAFIYSTVDRDKMFKYYQIISAKYYENFQEDSLNEVNSAVINYQNLYDVKAYSLKLSFDITDKKIFGIMNMRSLCLSDTLNFIYIDLSDDLKINSIKINGDELSKSSYKRKSIIYLFLIQNIILSRLQVHKRIILQLLRKSINMILMEIS